MSDRSHRARTGARAARVDCWYGKIDPHLLGWPIAQQRACDDTGIDQEKAGADMIIVRALFLVISGGKIDSFPQFIARLTAETEALVYEPMNWARMLAVANALAERRMLAGQELVEVIKAVPAGIDPPPPTCQISYAAM